MKDKGRLLVLVFIGSEAFFFIALIVAYVYYRNFTNATDTVAANLNALRSGIFTSLLIASSFTLLWGKKALAKNRWRTYKTALAATIILGAVFMVGQVTEYMGLYNKQLTMKSDVFGSSFFTLTGFHGLHVILGLIALSIMFGLSFGKFKRVSRAGMGGVEVYWHFVDVVWIIVFFFVYIKPLL